MCPERVRPFIIELSPAERAALESTSHRYTAPYRDTLGQLAEGGVKTTTENPCYSTRAAMPGRSS